MTTLKRTNSSDPDFLKLVKLLDADLLAMYGDEMDFYKEFNTVEEIKHVIVAYHNNNPAGCGAFKQYAPGVMEVKRIFVDPAYRGKGIAEKVMTALEDWAAELAVKQMILETGDLQQAAVALYEKIGYKLVDNYGQYSGAPSSICFSKFI